MERDPKYTLYEFVRVALPTGRFLTTIAATGDGRHLRKWGGPWDEWVDHMRLEGEERRLVVPESAVKSLVEAPAAAGARPHRQQGRQSSPDAGGGTSRLRRVYRPERGRAVGVTASTNGIDGVTTHLRRWPRAYSGR
jgi:hypothetical protein